MCETVLNMNLDSIVFYDDEWILYNDDGTYEFSWLNENRNSKKNKMLQLGVWWNKSGIIDYFVRPPTNKTNVLFSNSFENVNVELRESKSIAKRYNLMIDFTNPEFTLDIYKYIKERNFTILPLTPESEKDSPTRFYLFEKFNKHITNKKKKYNGNVIRAMEDFCKKDSAFFEVGVLTFAGNCMKYYNKNKKSVKVPQIASEFDFMIIYLIFNLIIYLINNIMIFILIHITFQMQNFKLTRNYALCYLNAYI
jgi:hypothetical protein